MPASKHVTFGGFRLDRTNECLWKGAQAISLRPKAFAVLKHLIEHAGQLVTKQQLLDTVWPATFVGDAVLKDSIRQLREALVDDAACPRYIETAHRRGYRFIAQISDEIASASPPSEVLNGGIAPAVVVRLAPVTSSRSHRPLLASLAGRQSLPRCASGWNER